MKRLFSICLILILCFQMTAFGYYDDTVGAEFENEINYLTAAGILNGSEDGSFHPQDNVTRAELVTVLVRMLGFDYLTVGDRTYYTDVDRDYWALSEINIATMQGFVNGYADGTFLPENNVTLEESIKIILCALGYAPLAELSGGFPQGYMLYAAKNKITAGISRRQNEYITRADMAKLIYSSLTVNIVKQSKNEAYSITDETVLSSILKIHEREGIVTATKYANLVPTAALEDDEIAIDSVVYKIDDEFLHELAGYRIKFYFKETDDYDQKIIYYEIKDQGNKTIWVEAGDVATSNADTVSNKFTYYDENGKKKSVKTDFSYIVYNGEHIENAAGIFDIDDGSVFLIDSDGDSVYETVFVNNTKSIIVGKINKENYIVKDKINATLQVDFDSESPDREVSIIKDNKLVDFDAIAVDDVLTVTESIDKKRVTAIISTETAQGLISSMKSDNNALHLTINQQKYTISGLKYEQFEENGILDAIAPGVEVKAYIDSYGRIAGLDLLGAGDEKYAVAIAAYEDSSPIEKKIILKMYPESGNVQNFVLADSVYVTKGYNRIKCSPEEALEELKASRLVDTDSRLKTPVFQLIKYKLDKDGNINNICIATEAADGGPVKDEWQFTLDFSADSFCTNRTNIINAAYLIDSETKVFVIPEDHTEYKNYDRSITLSNSMSARLALYDVDKTNHISVALVIYDEASGSGSVYDNSIYTPFFTVAAVGGMGMNDDEEIVHQPRGCYNNNELYPFSFEEDPNFNVGDIYQFAQRNGKVTLKKKVFDGETFSFVYTETNEHGYKLISNGSAAEGSRDWWNKIMTDAVVGYVKVVNVESNVIILSDGEREYRFTIPNNARYAMIDRENDEIDVCTIDDVDPGDNIVVRAHNMYIGDIVVIR